MTLAEELAKVISANMECCSWRVNLTPCEHALDTAEGLIARGWDLNTGTPRDGVQEEIIHGLHQAREAIEQSIVDLGGTVE